MVRHPGGMDTEDRLQSGFSGEDSFWTFLDARWAPLVLSRLLKENRWATHKGLGFLSEGRLQFLGRSPEPHPRSAPHTPTLES